jgi:hypothetical protein
MYSKYLKNVCVRERYRFYTYHCTSIHPLSVALERCVLIKCFFLVMLQILLESDNYVTRRRSLKLLGELLLDRR